VQGTVTRTTTLWLKCNAAKTQLPLLGSNACPNAICVDVSESSVCQYQFAPIEWCGFCPLGTGCAGGGGPSSFDDGWIFVIIVLCGLFLYFVVGIIVLKFVMHKEGREIVPQVEFWAALPGLVLDGMKFAWRKITCQTGGYTEV
jgi:hypothetical protein